MIYSRLPTDWKDLEKKAAAILEGAGYLDVEIGKEVQGVRGTIALDVFAHNNYGSLVCECKNWNKAIPKSVAHSFRTVVGDVGASRGFLISKKGFQSGAYSAVESTNVRLVDWYEFQDQVEDEWLESTGRHLYKYVSPLFRFTDVLVSGALLDPLSDKDKEHYWTLYENYQHVWPMPGKLFMPFSLSTVTKKEAAERIRKEICFPLQLKVPMSEEIITINDFEGYRDYIVRHTDEGVRRFQALTGK